MPPPPIPRHGPPPAAPDGAASFADLGLPPALLWELARQRISAPFAIQAATLPGGPSP